MAQINNKTSDKSKRQRETFDFTGLILDYLTNWKWFVLSAIICCAFGYFYGAMKIPVYQMESMLYITSDQSSSLMAVSKSMPMFTMPNENDETELEIMKSRNSMVRIVDSLGLSYYYYEKGTLRDNPLYLNNPVVVSMPQDSLRTLKGSYDIKVKPLSDGNVEIKGTYAQKGALDVVELKHASLPCSFNLGGRELTVSRSPFGEPFDSEIIVNIVSPRERATQILDALRLEYIRKSEKIVHVQLNDEVERRAQDIIYGIVNVYNQDIIENQNKAAIQTEQFLLSRLVGITAELQDVENRLENYREQHGITNEALQNTIGVNLSYEYEQTLSGINGQLVMIEGLQNMINSATEYEALPMVGSEKSAVANLISVYNAKVNRFNRLKEGTTADNPMLAMLRQELARDKQAVAENLTMERNRIVEERNRIAGMASKNTGKLTNAPGVENAMQEILREQKVKAGIYTFLLERREEIALQKALAVNTVRLIDNPAQERKVSPHRFLIMVMALIFGLGIPALIIYLRRQMFARFADQNELEKMTEVPILGEICATKTGKENVLVVGKDLATPVAELFRLLRNNMSFAKGGQNNKVILVTSSISGEGKTFVAANLALTYALMGKRVCVVGMDLRRPMLAHDLGVSNRAGLTNYLSGHATDYTTLLQQSRDNENLFILPAGPVPPNPNELLMSDRMTEIIDLLRNDFDYVIIDSAPIGLVSDTLLILRQSDIQIYVTRANYTTRKGLKTLQDAVDLGKFTNVYIVINGVDIHSGAYNYRRYGHYGYGSRKAYGYGYASKK
ncbi:MAG: polysaccharide biosynthesis tyrosine autokinase [Muribaculaceae bacterium]|nr:polysaccharide biosynthesis tyrosine autokinase [Muribaculaceae bacterium]